MCFNTEAEPLDCSSPGASSLSSTSTTSSSTSSFTSYSASSSPNPFSSANASSLHSSLASVQQTITYSSGRTLPAYLEGLPSPSLNLDPATTVHLVYTDGGSYGVGGHSGKKWFSLNRGWSTAEVQHCREAIALRAAAKLWHKNWHKSHVIFHTDSQCVARLQPGRHERAFKRALSLVHDSMQSVDATYEIRWVSRNHPELVKADALSKQRIEHFRTQLSPNSYPPHRSRKSVGGKGLYQRTKNRD